MEMPALFVLLKVILWRIGMLEGILEQNDVGLVLASDPLSLKLAWVVPEFDLSHL